MTPAAAASVSFGIFPGGRRVHVANRALCVKCQIIKYFPGYFPGIDKIIFKKVANPRLIQGAGFAAV
jgi:hypothetical protein